MVNTAGTDDDDLLSFDFAHYLNVLRRFLPLLIIVPLVAAGAAGIATLQMPRVYQSQVSLLLRPAQPIASSDPTVAQLTSDQIAATYAILLTEPPLLQQVISELHLSTTPAQLGKSVTVTAEPSTTILDVAAQAGTPALSRDIANRLVADFIVHMRSIQSAESTSKTGPPKDDFVIVAPAVAPTAAISPSLKKNGVEGLVAGLVLALVIVVVASLMDQTVKRDEDLLRRTGLIALAHIPLLPAPRRAMGELSGLIVDSPAAEAYRVLRTNVVFSSLDQPARTIVVTSARPGEGKSRTAANLAIAMSQAGHRTLLVDADLRRPSQHRMFGRVRNLGLTNLLLEDVPEEQVLWSDGRIPSFWLLPSGPVPPNPAELLGSGKMRALLQRLAQSYAFVILDAPPVTAVTDPCVLGAGADGCLIVVEQRHTKYADVSRARSQLERVGAHVLGVVLNKVQGPEAAYYSYGYASHPQREEERTAEPRERRQRPEEPHVAITRN